MWSLVIISHITAFCVKIYFHWGCVALNIVLSPRTGWFPQCGMVTKNDLSIAVCWLDKNPYLAKNENQKKKTENHNVF